MTAASALHPGARSGFPRGFTAIAREGLAAPAHVFDTGMDFGIQCCAPGETLSETPAKETVWVLLHGQAEVECARSRKTVSRTSLFDEPPTALHVGAGTPLSLRTGTGECEWAVIRTANPARLEPRLFLPGEIAPEYRGAGLVQNTALRNVRLLFDQAARPGSKLVVGEVVNYPGRWSSYPPHHHDQPEIYHYRFTHPAGYGHAENGETVYKVRHGDTLFITPGLDHAQASAPGYGMYYLWFIRHLPGNPYTGFTYAEEHQWALDPRQQGWQPLTPPPASP